MPVNKSRRIWALNEGVAGDVDFFSLPLYTLRHSFGKNGVYLGKGVLSSIFYAR